MVGVNVSASNIFGLGYGFNIQGSLMLRGKDAGAVHGTWGYNGRLGKDAGVSATLMQGWFNGDPRNATFNGLLGKGADVSGAYEGAVAGGWVSFNSDYSISWFGTSYGIGFGPNFGPKFGVSAGFGPTVFVK